jgi:uncharacterized membrane protein
LGWLLGVIGFVVFSLVSVWGILEALMGNTVKIPLVSDIAEKVIL